MLTPLTDVPEPVIPSESSILASRQKRERLRVMASAGTEDFISLSVAKQDNASRGPHPESRLVREEDEIGEGDDGMSACLYAVPVLIFALRIR
jgi:GC-rich sequence DNA-binding factor